MEALRGVGSLPQDQRKAAGALLNEVKLRIEAALSARVEALEGASAGPALDVTLPGRGIPQGSPHPVPLTISEITGIFRGMGFATADGPEIETEANNFDALNTPADHPARDSHDTFYLGHGSLLLRTHTSSVWARAMREGEPPLRIICPGRCYRRDALDATHAPCFFQVEGLWVDDACRFSDLKGLLSDFFSEFFGRTLRTRFEPRFFPFTEPSTEVSIECTSCGGSGCPGCGRSGWLEVLGAGMVHPKILAAAGGAWAKPGVRGLAFGMGVERLAMLKHRIADLRWLYDNDLRVLAQARG